MDRISLNGILFMVPGEQSTLSFCRGERMLRLLVELPQATGECYIKGITQRQTADVADIPVQNQGL